MYRLSIVPVLLIALFLAGCLGGQNPDYVSDDRAVNEVIGKYIEAEQSQNADLMAQILKDRITLHTVNAEGDVETDVLSRNEYVKQRMEEWAERGFIAAEFSRRTTGMTGNSAFMTGLYMRDFLREDGSRGHITSEWEFRLTKENDSWRIEEVRRGAEAY